MEKISALCHRHRMYRFLCFLFLVSACDVRGAPVNEPGFTASARALDGDTIAADFRLLGVDAFERRQLCERARSCWECGKAAQDHAARILGEADAQIRLTNRSRSEEHTSELQSLMRISYAVFCLKKKQQQ